MTINLDKKEWKYIIILYLVSFIIQIFLITQGGEDYKLFTPIAGAMMFLPAIGAIICLIKSPEGLKYINWKFGKPKHILLGLIIPTIITLFSVIFLEAIGLGTNKYFGLQSSQVNVTGKSFLLGNGNQNIFFFLLNILVTGIAYSVVTGLVTLGEEIGWRGYLQKKLLEKNSVFKSICFLGLIWGFWHLPIVLSGYNYPEHPFIGGFIWMPLTLVFGSFLLAWLTINGKSIWPAVFAHGGVNSIMSILDSMEFGENNLIANFLIVGIWSIVALISYKLINKEDSKKAPA